MEADLNRLGEALILTEKEELGVVMPSGVWHSDPKTRVIVESGQGMDITFIEHSRFLMKFFHTVDRDRVLASGPWAFEKNLIVFTKVEEDENPADVELTWCDFHVRIHGLPLGKMTKEIAGFIGSKIGCLRELGHIRNGVSLVFIRILLSPGEYPLWTLVESGATSRLPCPPLPPHALSSIIPSRHSGPYICPETTPRFPPASHSSTISAPQLDFLSPSISSSTPIPVTSSPTRSLVSVHIPKCKYTKKTRLTSASAPTHTQNLAPKRKLVDEIVEAAPPRAMSLLVWNCQGLGNPWTVRGLQELIRVHNPLLVFLTETKCSASQIEVLKRRLDLFGVGVSSVGKSGGLALLWQKA
ncbi:UNVERIFIED_CONTAM: hypothetical protein Slati_0411200 [Sesamum latifolium]|uniref:DUF4283 domain-containing protein n=1 Tax=Sesamum latifolium TaxID=2727402 RepID=A0AAW2XV46_9LAMI